MNFIGNQREKMDVSSALNNKIVEYLTSLPNIEDINTRRALISNAGLEPQFENSIDFSIAPGPFFSLLVKNLIRFGELRDGRDALEAVLDASKHHIGRNRKEVCADLIQEWRRFQSSSREEPSSQDENACSATTIVPGYQYDIFISYVQEDDMPSFHDGKGLITQTIEFFMKDVDNQISCQIERFPLWSRYSEFDSTIQDVIQKSAVTVVILSKNYQKHIQNSLNGKEFIYALQKPKVFLLEIDEIQDSFRANNIIPCKLWQKKHDKREYFNHVRDLSKDIADAILELKKDADLHAKMPIYGQVKGKPIFINHAPVDKPLLDELLQRLRHEFAMQGHITFPLQSKEFSENMRWFESRILNCDGLLVVYGKVSPVWVGDQLDLICKILPQRKQFPEACVLYYGPPDGKYPLPSDFPGIISVDCQKCPGQDKKCGHNATCAKELLKFVSLLI